jgi:hypothetical protein
MLAAVLTLAGGTAPVAYGFDDSVSPASGAGQPPALVEHHPGGSIDGLLGVGVAGGIALVATGLVASQRGTRRAASRTGRVRTAGRP